MLCPKLLHTSIDESFLIPHYERKDIAFCGRGIEPLVDFTKDENEINVHILVPGANVRLWGKENGLIVCTDCNRSGYKGVRILFTGIDYTRMEVVKGDNTVSLRLPYIALRQEKEDKH